MSVGGTLEMYLRIHPNSIQRCIFKPYCFKTGVKLKKEKIDVILDAFGDASPNT